MKTLLLASAVFAGLFVSLAAVPVPVPTPAPYHAFCKTMWLFAGSCTDIKTMLLVSVFPGFVKANHTSPKTPEGETIIISFYPTILTGGYRMSALSTSNGFTSLFDGGQNYCNLYNLVSAEFRITPQHELERTHGRTSLHGDNQ
ncbi:hypothetical protein JOQ06_001097 [Pogonophryne albipinna]|uniref:Uncharacterized protein n=1 Tax=Pogonophryne albipinna TaxID=1090488 RepID=A0AAD6FK72_9TELE|nr:hypothetical protein JOQ06_001097 [Pogonophryne albipinna]